MKKKPRKADFCPPRDPERPTLEEFSRMVEAHDPTHVWSRNPEEKERGAAERMEIDRARLVLGDGATVPVWNRAMHRKVVPSMLGEFLWRVEQKAKAV